MAGGVKFSVTLEADLAARLTAAATEHGWTPESLIRECVAQHLEMAIRHRVVLERLEQVDAAILEMAEAVGELGTPATSIDLSKVCRYAAPADEVDPDAAA